MSIRHETSGILVWAYWSNTLIGSVHILLYRHCKKNSRFGTNSSIILSTQSNVSHSFKMFLYQMIKIEPHFNALTACLCPGKEAFTNKWRTAFFKFLINYTSVCLIFNYFNFWTKKKFKIIHKIEDNEFIIVLITTPGDEWQWCLLKTLTFDWLLPILSYSQLETKTVTFSNFEITQS